MKKPVPERISHFTEQKNKRSEAIKIKNKAVEMHKHKTRTVFIERGFWIQVNDLETPAEIIRQRFIDAHKNSQFTSKTVSGGKNDIL